MQIKRDQIFKLLAIINFILLIRNLLLLKSVHPIGYITNIYMMFPLTFYLSFIFCYFISGILVLNNYKKIGIFTLCLNHLEILLIPYMLGYYSMGRADDMSYIGEYLQIAKSGNFSNWDIYPASHIIGSFISLLSNLEAHNTSFIVPIVFSFVFILGVNLFSKEFISESFFCSLVLISSFILYLGDYNFLNVPNALFFAYMPLYLCYFHRYLLNYTNRSLSVIFVLMTLIIPFSHPYIIFFVLMVFLLHITVPIISSKLKSNILMIPQVKISSLILQFLVIATWYIYCKKLMVYSRRAYLSYLNRTTNPVILETATKLSKVDLSFFDYSQLIVFHYGRYLFPTMFIIASFIFIYHNREFLNKRLLNKYSYLLILHFTFVITQLILLVNPIISHQPDRIVNLNFTVYTQIPLFSFAIYLLFLRKSVNFKKVLQACGIITLIWSLSLFGCFDSPNVFKANSAVTYNEVSGMNWFYQVKDNSGIYVPFSQLNRFHDLFGDSQFDNPEKMDTVYTLPDHFGYVNKSDTFDSINLNKGMAYIVILTVDELIYQEVPGYITVGRYISPDFIQFRKDRSVNKIYDSVNIEVFTSGHDLKY